MKRIALLVGVMLTLIGGVAALTVVPAGPTASGTQTTKCYEQVTEYLYQKYTQERTREDVEDPWGPWTPWTPWNPPLFKPWTTTNVPVIEGPADHDGNGNNGTYDRDYQYQQVDSRVVNGEQIPCPTTTTSTTTTLPASTTTTTCPDCVINTVGVTTTTTTIPATTSTTSSSTTSTTTTTVPGATTTQPPAHQPFTFGAAATVCVAEVPTIRITFLNTFPELAGRTGTLTMSALNGGAVVSTQPLVYQPGTTVDILYPGTRVNADGSIADVPGWNLQANGLWVRDPSDAYLRDGIALSYTVNPTATALVTYPPESANCANPENPATPPTGGLPSTL